MKCYKHNGLDAVSTCNSCSKAMCNECTNYFDTPVCIDCNLNLVSEERTNYFKNLALMGLLFVVGIMFAQTENTGLFLTLFTAYMFAGIPWGWSVLSNITPNVFLFLPIVGWVIYFVLKVMISSFVGVFITPFKVMQAVKGIKETKSLEGYISDLKAS
ncbi:hypothetical protein ACKXGF_12305 [Alkalibacillus sp. S2W]|uniref:hypothetical protein n=1 Tax=Alkalibacillus sp. S2W TaxID=3386553 RepID=UPI00398D4487